MNNAISSQASACGPLRFAALDGMTIAEYGRALAPANLSARQAAGMGFLTSGISGPRGSTSLRSAALQSSLENRLRAEGVFRGSTLYELTWKTRVTPAGAPICALRARALRTTGQDFYSRPLPTPSGTSNGGKNHVAGRLDEWGEAATLFVGPTLAACIVRISKDG